MRSIGKKLLDELIELQRAYASTYRAITTEERYNNLIISKLIKDFTYDSNYIREPLLEHSGHLPIIASHLWPLIQHRGKVNLGRVLIMLSVHDIGEIEIGDVITYHKSKAHKENEIITAKKRLSKEMLEYYIEFENQETMDAKFAKAVDALAPELHELALPEVTKERFMHFNFNTDSIVEKKEKHFVWDEVLKQLFDAMISEYREIVDK